MAGCPERHSGLDRLLAPKSESGTNEVGWNYLVTLSVHLGTPGQCELSRRRDP